MKIRPLHDRILIKRQEEKETRKGGIIIPDSAKEKPQEGKVIAVGNGKVTDEGKKIAQGTGEEVRNDPKVIEAYLGHGVSGATDPQESAA